jgi:hypothetical protein
VTEPQQFSNWQQLLTGTSYNMDHVENASSIIAMFLVAVETFLFAEPLLSNGCLIVVV